MNYNYYSEMNCKYKCFCAYMKFNFTIFIQFASNSGCEYNENK